MKNEMTENDNDFGYTGPSKTSLKKAMLVMQETAVQLTQLNREQLAKIPLTPELLSAIEETGNIHKNEALRRHYQYLGRLMRSADHEAIAAALDGLKEQQDRVNRLFHQMEQWRDQLIQGDQATLEDFIEQFPYCDRQTLRQLVRNAKTEQDRNKAATGAQPQHAQARKLFRFIRELITHVPDDD